MTQKTNTEQSLTLAGLKNVLPFATLLVALVLAWASLTSQVTLLSERQMIGDKKVDGLSEQVKDMNDELVRLTTIIDSAQKAGQLSLTRPQLVRTTTITPTPAQRTEPEVQNTVLVNNTVQPTPTPHPALPTPISEPELTPILCVIGLCL